MSRQTMKAPVTALGLEFKMGQLPPEFRSAIRFSDAHGKRVLVGYVKDEDIAYLMTVDDEDIDA